MSNKIILPVVLLVALLIRIYAAFFSGLDPMVFDSTIYMRVAHGIVDGSPAHSFPNGYPLLIALLLTVVPSEHIVSILLGINIALGTAVVGLTYAIAERVTHNRRFALLVATAIAVYPHQIHYTRLIMTEVLCTFLLTLATLLALIALRPRSAESHSPQLAEKPDEWGPTWLLLTGVFYALSSSVRPSVTLVGPIVMIFGFLFTSGKQRLGVAFVALAFTVIQLFFVGLEKANITATPATFGNNVLISITSDSRDVVFREFPPEEQRTAVSTYIRFALKQPGTFLLQRVLSLWELWGPYALGIQPENRALPVRFIVLLRPILLSLACVCVWRNRRKLASWILFAPILGLTLIHIPAFSNHRFTAPIEPMLFVLAGVTVWQFVAARRPNVPSLDIIEGDAPTALPEPTV